MRFLRRTAPKPDSILPAKSLVVFVCSEADIDSMDIATGPFKERVGPRGGRVKPLASVLSQQYGDTLDHLGALFSLITGRSADEAWAEIRRRDAASLARFSDAFVEALAPIGPPRREGQDLGAIYHRIAEKWITAVRWSPRMQVGGLTMRIFDYSHRCRIGMEKGLPVWAWYGPRVPAYGIAHGVGQASYEEYRTRRAKR